MRYKLVTAPTVEPLTTAEAKDHARITHSVDDSLVDRYVAQARRQAETYTRRALIAQTWNLVMDDFPTDTYRNPGQLIYLPKGNTLSVTSITYTDAAGASQTLTGPSSSPDGTDYQEDLNDDAGGILSPPYNSDWPEARVDTLGAVTVQFVAGYGTARTDVPQDILSAIQIMVADLYYRRTQADFMARDDQQTISPAARALLHPYRIDFFPTRQRETRVYGSDYRSW